MTKKQALKLFGGMSKLATALRIKRQSIEQWPDDEEIQEPRRSHVILAALELGLIEWTKNKSDQQI